MIQTMEERGPSSFYPKKKVICDHKKNGFFFEIQIDKISIIFKNGGNTSIQNIKSQSKTIATYLYI